VAGQGPVQALPRVCIQDGLHGERSPQHRLHNFIKRAGDNAKKEILAGIAYLPRWCQATNPQNLTSDSTRRTEGSISYAVAQGRYFSSWNCRFEDRRRLVAERS